MTTRLSTGMIDDLLENPGVPKAILVGADIGFVDGGTGNDQIDRTSGSWISDGFQVGDWVQIFGATTTANNVLRKILAVATLTLDIATASITTAEDGVATTAVVSAKGGSLNDLLKFGYIKIYSGAQPASADLIETGDMLVKVTKDGAAHNTSTGLNGLEWNDDAATNRLSKLTAQVWSGSPALSGNAGWFRFYAQEGTEGASTTAVRFDGAVGTSGTELVCPTIAIATGTDFIITNFEIILPAS